MSKYDALWAHIAGSGEDRPSRTFDEIREVLGFELDHSFLTHKRELEECGYAVSKISLKNKIVYFERCE